MWMIFVESRMPNFYAHFLWITPQYATLTFNSQDTQVADIPTPDTEKNLSDNCIIKLLHLEPE